MPREHLSAQNLHVPSPDGNGFRTHTRTLEVTWSKAGDAVVLTPGWYQDNYPDAEQTHPDAAFLPEAFDPEQAKRRTEPGWHTFDELARALSWRQVNDLIKVLKRARDDAFGRPE